MVKVVRTPGPGHTVLAALATLNENQVGVGWFKTSKYHPSGTPAAYVAAIQEFGYAPHNLPPRLGLRQLAIDKKASWAGISASLAKQVIAGTPVEAMLTAIGETVRGDIQDHISNVTQPPLAESTLQNRASRLHIPVSELTETGKKPLVEPKQADGSAGGYLLTSVQYIVGKKGGTELA
jgi:hypothetical protein